VIAQVPHLYDGGYYYVMPEVVDEGGVRGPGEVGDFAGASYASGYVVFRKVEQATLPEQPVTVEQIANPSKPWGRIGGL